MARVGSSISRQGDCAVCPAARGRAGSAPEGAAADVVSSTETAPGSPAVPTLTTWEQSDIGPTGQPATTLLVGTQEPGGTPWQLCLRWDEGREPSSADRASLQAVARIVQCELEFRDALRRMSIPFTENALCRRRHQAALAAFVQRALFLGTGREVLGEGAELAAELLEAPVVQYFGSANSQGVRKLEAAYGIAGELLGRIRARPGRASLGGWVGQEGAPLTTQESSRERRYRPSALLRARGIHSSAAVPVWPGKPGGGTITGVLAAHWVQPRRVRAVDLQFLQSLAVVFAAAEATREARAVLFDGLFGGEINAEIQSQDGWIPVAPSFRAAAWDGNEPPGKWTSAIIDELPLPSEVRDSLAHALQQGEPWHGEVEDKENASRRWTRVSAIPASWARGRLASHQILLTDVTRRRFLEEAVHDMATRWRHRSGGTAVGAAIMDGAGHVLWSNGEWRRRRLAVACPLEVPAYLDSSGRQRLCSSPTCGSNAAELSRGFREVLAGKRVVFEAEYRCASAGQARWYAVRLEAAGRRGENVECITVAEWDSTQAHLAEDELRHREARAQAVLHGTNEAFLTVNHRGIIESASPVAARLFATRGQDLVGRRLSQLLPAQDEPSHDPILGQMNGHDLARLAGTERETWGRRLDGSTFPMTLRLSEAWIGRHPTYTAVLRDGSDRREAEELLERLIYHDTVTRLPNRLLFRDRLDLAIQQGRHGAHQVGTLVLDVDRFGVINDSLGHYAGDRFLEQVARRLEGAVRAGDLVARWGGDEFNILLPRVLGAEEAAGVAHRIRESIRRPFEIDGQSIYATVSVGLAVYPRDGTDADGLIRAADLSLYRAKRQGGDASLAFSPEMQRRASQELSLDAELHRAADRGEFAVYYQPEVALADERVIGGECLIRWEHPRKGILPPRAFLPLAEKTGLIVPVGMSVVRTACEQIARWQSQASGWRRIAVNLSLRQIRHPSLLPEVEKILRETGANPSWLDLEISEAIAVSALASQLPVLRALKSLGLRMSLDDFGQGYSSLKHLRRLPIETVKIDRSFVRRICRDRRDAAIVRAVIQIGHSLGLRVVAEGVTRPEEVEVLRNEGCDTAQGFLFGRALPRSEFEGMLLGDPGFRETPAA